MLAKGNLFVAWFLIAQIFLNDVLATVGAGVLGVLGMHPELANMFGWLVGAMLLAAVLLIVRNVLGELPPGVGKPGGKGYRLGHTLLLASSWLALGVYVVPMFIASIASHNAQVLLASFAIGFMYTALGLFGFGLSLIYQSALPSSPHIKS
jgi:phosphoglycerol transferase MdoB-like AlkP superfamily enzyme